MSDQDGTKGEPQEEQQDANGGQAEHTNIVVWWVAGLCVRAFLVAVPGAYIHPDEFFQSVEIVSGDVLDIQHTRTWEFDPASPSRSVALTYLLFGLPLAAIQAMGLNVSSATLLFLPRVVMFALSLLTELCIYVIADLLGLDSSAAMALYATSYTSMTFLIRPFSNSVETALVAIVLLLVAVVTQHASESKLDSFHSRPSLFLIGLIGTVACFNRITFPAFVLPFAAHVLKLMIDRGSTDRSETAAKPTSSLWKLLCNTIASLWSVVAGAVIALTAVISFDSAYFSHFSRLVIAPLNNLLYNVSSENLKEHGLHPRWLHVAVNFPLLFGPVWLALPQILSEFVPRSTLNISAKTQYKLCLAASIMSALALLSIFPHQEARFLLPMIVPLSLVAGSSVFGKVSDPKLRQLWIVFNVAMTLFYGVAHQGGVIEATTTMSKVLDRVSQVNDAFETHVIATHTYMLPTHLLNQKAEYGECSSPKQVHVHDLGDRSKITEMAALVHTLSARTLVHCDDAVPTFIFLIAPTAHYPRELHRMGFTEMRRLFPFWSAELPDLMPGEDVLEHFSLSLYRLRVRIQHVGAGFCLGPALLSGLDKDHLAYLPQRRPASCLVSS